MIYKIAICDDEDFFCTTLQEYIKEFMEEKQVQYEIYIFHDGAELCSQLDDNPFSLLLLDVEMPGLMGTSVAQLLREKNCNAPVIFVTSYDTFTKEAYQVEAIGYVTKPVDREKLFRCCDMAFEYMKKLGREACGGVLRIKQNKDSFTIAYHRILYIEKDGNQSRVCTIEDKQYDTYVSFKQITKDLDDDIFYRIDRSFIVNWNYVTDIQKYFAVFVCDRVKKEIPFSKKRYWEIQRIFAEKLNERGIL